ncbi:MAG: transposase [Flavobacteriales bacterium]|nr:transposase [Flavobacteriales bacterium]
MSQDKFQNKYRNGTFRAQWWNYGWNGAYFVTICTQDRECYFGEIKNGKMILSHVGVIAHLLWHEIPKHHQHIELGDFVVMPNHIHGIIIIDKPNDREINNGQTVGDQMVNGETVDGQMVDGETVGGQIIVGAGHALHLQLFDPTTPGSQRFQNIGKNTLSAVVGSYKSAVTKYANRLGYPNGWQRLFHEHIIRNDAEYQRISDYIVANPENWEKDKFKRQ